MNKIIIKCQKRKKLVLSVFITFAFTIIFNILLMLYRNNLLEPNIKVNNLSFNMITNSGTKNDRILHLQAGKLESYEITLTNLNNKNVKYELIYELCNDANCTSTTQNIPNDISIYKEEEETKINGNLDAKNNVSISIVTKNESNTDYYIKLNVNAENEGNDLSLTNQIKYSKNIGGIQNIVAYVDGEEINDLPSSCAYLATIKIYKNGKSVSSDSLNITCDNYNSKWSINFTNMTDIPDKVEIIFKMQEIMEYDFVSSTTTNSEPYYTFAAPKDGSYKLETWGAQGGCSLFNNKKNCSKLGYGGYSTGEITLKKGEILYVYIGGAGTNGTKKKNPAGGYNGGGKGTWDNSDDESSGGGGGATHIAKVSGLLSTLETNKDSIIIVSGGAGGQSAGYQAGSGGGFQGGITSTTKQTIVSQDSGYAFGKGQDASGTADSDGVGGGGGGLYGGYMNNVSYKSSGSGGSGYIGNSSLINKAMYCYKCNESADENTKTISTTCYNATPTSNCAKSGNGYAKITYMKY